MEFKLSAKTAFLQVKDCFVIDLDQARVGAMLVQHLLTLQTAKSWKWSQTVSLAQDAYMVAATGNETAIDDFWWSRMVLTEGSRVRCKTQTVSLLEQYVCVLLCRQALTGCSIADVFW